MEVFDEKRAVELGEMIKQSRISRRLTQRDAAKMCRLSPGFISMLERGVNPSTGRPLHPSPATLMALSEGLGLEYEDLMVLAGHWVDGMIDPDDEIEQVIWQTIGALSLAISTRRKEIGLTTAQVCAKADLPTGPGGNYIKRLEDCDYGELEPELSSEVLFAIEAALGLPAGKLVGIASNTRLNEREIPPAAADLWENFSVMDQEDQDEIRAMIERRAARIRKERGLEPQ